MSCVKCHMSDITCQVSHVRCQMYLFFFFFFDKVLELVGGGSVISGAYLNSLQEGYYNSINPLVEGVPPHIHRPSSARWRPVNMWGHPFDQGIISVVTSVPPQFHEPQIFRCLCLRPHLFPCSSMPWATVFFIGLLSLFSRLWLPSGFLCSLDGEAIRNTDDV